MTFNNKLTAQITCPQCSSSVEVYLNNEQTTEAICGVCEKVVPIVVTLDHTHDELKSCAVCQSTNFYQQKDFNRKIGVALFVVAAILSIWTYGLSFIAFWLVDVFLFKKLGSIVICYKCETIYRKVKNLNEINDFDHQMHDRIVYSEQEL